MRRRANDKIWKAQTCVACDLKRGLYVCSNDKQHYCLSCLRTVDSEAADKFAKTIRETKVRGRTQRNLTRQDTKKYRPCVKCNLKRGLNLCLSDQQHYCLTCLRTVDSEAAEQVAKTRRAMASRARARRGQTRREKKYWTCVACDWCRGRYVCSNDKQHYCLTCLRTVDSEAAAKIMKTKASRVRARREQMRREKNIQKSVEMLD